MCLVRRRWAFFDRIRSAAHTGAKEPQHSVRRLVDFGLGDFGLAGAAIFVNDRPFADLPTV